MENSTAVSQNVSDITYSLPKEVDYSMRVIALLFHIFYFSIVFVFKELQNISFIQMHHTNLIGFITTIHYTSWIKSNAPEFNDENLNNFFCSLSEATWALTKHARAYSILILAIYRVVAVFKMNFYKKIANSIKFTIFSILIVWLISGFIFLISKYSTHVMPGKIYCYDGYSSSIEKSLIYYSITSILGYMLPGFGVIFLYAIIRIRLQQVSNRVLNEKSYNTEMESSMVKEEKKSETLEKKRKNLLFNL